MAQMRVNERLLGGFEGFRGELAELWRKQRLANDQRLAQHRIRDERRNEAIKKDVLDNGAGWEEAAKLRRRLDHTGIPGPDSGRVLLRATAETEERQKESANSGFVGIVEGRVVEETNSSPSEEVASHVGLGGESVQTSTEDAHVPPSIDEGSNAALREVELVSSVEGTNALPSVEASSQAATTEVQSAEDSVGGGESVATDASPTVEADSQNALEGGSGDSPVEGERKSASSIEPRSG
jgi:hypothetical protein